MTAGARNAHEVLLTDQYQLAMLQAYHAYGTEGVAVFEFFVRNLPARRGFLMAAGLDQVVEFLEGMRFGPPEIGLLHRAGGFPDPFLDWLAALSFTGDVDAVPEGSIVFADEPILRVVAPLPEAQLVETRLVNLLHFETVVASKAARMILAAPGKSLVDFGLRRAHGAEAGLLAARASYIAGFSGTATTLAGLQFGIPLYGTMAHSFIEVYDGERRAFEQFALARPQDVILLIDTYDTEHGARNAVAVAKRLRESHVSVRGVRIDSGDLDAEARRVRAILDAAGEHDAIIFASGGLDEDQLATLVAAGAPIDGFGIGTSLTTSSDAPALDCAYKLQEYNGVPRRKRSSGKANWPGRKQVWRRFDGDGTMIGDIVAAAYERHEGQPLLVPVMRQGKRLGPAPSLETLRTQAAAGLKALPKALARLQPYSYPVAISEELKRMAAECDRRTDAAQSALV